MKIKEKRLVNILFFTAMFVMWFAPISLLYKGVGVITVITIDWIYSKLSNGELVSKKRHLLTYILLIGLIITGFIVFKPHYESTVFIIKHFVLFGVIALLITFLAIRIYKGYHQDDTISFKRKRLLRGFTLVMIFITIGLFSQLQLYYINNFEIPPLYGCSYYDEYNHLIYQSQYAGNCPELKDVMITDTDDGSKLSFSVKETDLLQEEGEDDLYTVTQISYEYDEQNRIINYNMETTYEFYRQLIEGQPDRVVEVYYVSRSVENTYGEHEIKSVHTEYENYLSSQYGLELPYNKTYLKTGREEPRVIEYRSKLVDDFEIDHHEDLTWAEHLIDIDYRKITEEDQSPQYDDLYDVYTENNHYYIGVPGTKDAVNLYRTKDDEIKRWFFTESFEDNSYNFRNDYYAFETVNDQSIPITTHTKGAMSTYDENTELVTRPEDDSKLDRNGRLSGDMFNHIQTKVIDENYGFRLEHYSIERYTGTVSILGFKDFNTRFTYDRYPTNELAIHVDRLYSASFNYKYPHTSPKSFVYQKNPLLFEDRFMSKTMSNEDEKEE